MSAVRQRDWRPRHECDDAQDGDTRARGWSGHCDRDQSRWAIWCVDVGIYVRSSPAISQVSPSTLPLSGGPITINGANFQMGATVLVGSRAATSVVFVGEAQLTAVAPSGTCGVTDFVTVTNPDAQSATEHVGILYIQDQNDRDCDGLSDVWEIENFGSPTVQNGSGNPDRDTLTNLEEFREGTNPNEAVRYFAEGSTSGFKTRISILNPHEIAVQNVTLVFQPIGKPEVTFTPPRLPLAPRTRMTVDVETDVDRMSGQQFSTVVRSDIGLVVDRTMTWGGPNGLSYGSHAETGVLQPATKWYFAEG